MASCSTGSRNYEEHSVTKQGKTYTGNLKEKAQNEMTSASKISHTIFTMQADAKNKGQRPEAQSMPYGIPPSLRRIICKQAASVIEREIDK